MQCAWACPPMFSKYNLVMRTDQGKPNSRPPQHICEDHSQGPHIARLIVAGRQKFRSSWTGWYGFRRSVGHGSTVKRCLAPNHISCCPFSRTWSNCIYHVNGTQWNDQGHSSQFGSHTFSRLEITSQCQQMFLCNIQFKIIILIHFILIMRTIYCQGCISTTCRGHP